MSAATGEQKVCPHCSTPLLGDAPCTCGHDQDGAVLSTQVPVARVSQAPTPTPPIGEWLRIAGQRALAVVTMQPTADAMPLPATLISMGVRALLLALLAAQTVVSVMKMAIGLNPVTAFLLGPAVQGAYGKTFGIVLLSLVLAAGAGLGILYALVPRAEFPRAAATLADAQLPMLFGVTVALIVGTTFPNLLLPVFAAGIVWGQAIMTQGFMQTSVAPRTRMLLQIAIAAATCLVIGICLQQMLTVSQPATPSVFGR